MNFKFERINMKIVVAVGIAVILILTAIYVLFRTNLIIDHKKDKDSNSNSASSSQTQTNTNSGSNEPSDSNSSSNDPYADPEDPTPSNNSGVSQGAKDRTKPEDQLNPDEKKYIIAENIKEDLTDYLKKTLKGDEKKLKEEFTCFDVEEGCLIPVQNYVFYTKNAKIGNVIRNCKGNARYKYDFDKKEHVVTMEEVECERG